jgi:hypothetical protein
MTVSAECREDPGVLTSWNPTKPLRLVTGNLYLLVVIVVVVVEA